MVLVVGAQDNTAQGVSIEALVVCCGGFVIEMVLIAGSRGGLGCDHSSPAVPSPPGAWRKSRLAIPVRRKQICGFRSIKLCL